MKPKAKIATYSPDVDDFASRYDRMLGIGPGPWVLKTALVLASLLLLVVVLGLLLG